MIKAIQKGYTLTVTSWENDGDEYRTKQITVESRERAKALYALCNEVFVSGSNNGKGIGNLGDTQGEIEKAKEIIVSYMKAHPELYENVQDDRHLQDICMNYNQQMMGSSECYYSRVMESCVVTYSPEDIFLEEIKF